jgi:hypothetical protein
MPITKNIMLMLKKVVSGFKHIYVFINALNKCPKSNKERKKLFNVLHEIYGWKISSLYILTISKREINIQTSFNRSFMNLSYFKNIKI